METFLIKSGITMVVLLLLYHMLLEKEKMHRFNRFYLLFSLVFSFAVPLIVIPVYITAPVQLEASESAAMFMYPQSEYSVASETVYVPKTNYIPYIIWSLYTLVTLLLMMKFSLNIRSFIRKTKNSPSIPIGKAKLILLEEEVLPHTFLNYIFVNRKAYEAGTIEEELYTHEYTHVKQKHTLDILFIEVLKTFFWFNPILYIYKKAIQLNHEFLADQKVIATTTNTAYYQNLLLEKVNLGTTFPMASNLNFSLTKKRLLMMNKTTSKTKAVILKAVSLPVICSILYLICTESVAKIKEPGIQEQTSVKQTSMVDKETDKDKRRDIYYAGVRIIVQNTSKEVLIDKIYEQLTLEEKREYLFFVPDPFPKKQPMDLEFKRFKNNKKFAVWIDGKNVNNTILNNYKPSDFASQVISFVNSNARNKAHPQNYQVSLYTHSYYNKYLVNTHLKYGGSTFTCTLPNETLTAEEKQKEKELERFSGIMIESYIEKYEQIQNPEINPEHYQTSYTYAKHVEKISELDTYAEFPGGIVKLQQFMELNYIIPKNQTEVIKLYFTLTIEKDGSLTNVKPLRNSNSDNVKEAIRVLKMSPKWNPAIVNGEPVKSFFSTPIFLKP